MDEVQEVTNVNGQEGKNINDDYFRWSIEMDRLMLEVLKEQKLKGQNDDKSFFVEAYRVVVAEMNEKFGIKITRQKIVNRLKTLKDQMGLALIVLNQKSGFSWNDVTKKIDVEPAVWNDLINANDKMRLVQDKQLFNLELLHEIYEKDRATDDDDESANDKVQSWEREQREIRIEDIIEMQINNEIHLENFSPFDSHNSLSTSNNQAQTTSMSDVAASSSKEVSSKGTKQKAQVMKKIQEVTSAMKGIAQAILKTNRRIWIEEEIFAAMEKLSLKVTSLLDSVDWLVVHPILIGTFFVCPEDLRMEWLIRKMNN